MALRAGQEAQIQVMGALANGMESLMTQADSLNTQVQAVVDGVAGLGTQLSTLATEITIEVQQLVDAIAAQGANSAAIDSAVSRLQSTASALTGLSTQAADLTASLQADNPAPPAP
jgi:peptidoglycan hydrolase CwlO-like protein